MQRHMKSKRCDAGPIRRGARACGRLQTNGPLQLPVQAPSPHSASSPAPEPSVHSPSWPCSCAEWPLEPVACPACPSACRPPSRSPPDPSAACAPDTMSTPSGRHSPPEALLVLKRRKRKRRKERKRKRKRRRRKGEGW